jgi:hypothetical protein
LHISDGLQIVVFVRLAMSMTSPFQMTAVDDAAHLGVIECLQVLFPNSNGLGACFRGLLGSRKQDLKIRRLSEGSVAIVKAKEGKDEAEASDSECSTAEGSIAAESSDSEGSDTSVAPGEFQCPHCRRQFATEDELFSHVVSFAPSGPFAPRGMSGAWRCEP